MKRTIAILLSMMMCAGLLAGCGVAPAPSDAAASAAASAAQPASEPAEPAAPAASATGAVPPHFDIATKAMSKAFSQV